MLYCICCGSTCSHSHHTFSKTKLVASHFKDLDEEEAAKYTKMAEVDKARYVKEMKSYREDPDAAHEVAAALEEKEAQETNNAVENEHMEEAEIDSTPPVKVVEVMDQDDVSEEGEESNDDGKKSESPRRSSRDNDSKSPSSRKSLRRSSSEVVKKSSSDN